MIHLPRTVFVKNMFDKSTNPWSVHIFLFVCLCFIVAVWKAPHGCLRLHNKKWAAASTVLVSKSFLIIILSFQLTFQIFVCFLFDNIFNGFLIAFLLSSTHVNDVPGALWQLFFGALINLVDTNSYEDYYFKRDYDLKKRCLVLVSWWGRSSFEIKIFATC